MVAPPYRRLPMQGKQMVAANRDLIERMEKKIQATLARIWGEEA